jgi:hypothetical protein
VSLAFLVDGSLMKIMVDTNAPAGSHVRAADCVLEHAQSALELEDIQARLARLEQIENDKKKEDE